jgi:membrane-associated phospholipid phosphatase
LNPFLVGLAVIILISFKAASGAFDVLKWSLIITSLSILPVYLATLYLVRSRKVDSLFVNIRKQRTKVYLFAGACAVVGWGILLYFGAPKLLVATFVTGIIAVSVFTLVNLRWKISVHTAWMAASVTVLIILYGWIVAPALVLILLVGWARIELARHSLAQVVAGALFAALIAFGVFSISGLV